VSNPHHSLSLKQLHQKERKKKSKRKNKAIAKLIWTSDDYHAPMSREIHGYSSLHCSPTTHASGPFFAFHHSK